jgi:hypothetical protein
MFIKQKMMERGTRKRHSILFFRVKEARNLMFKENFIPNSIIVMSKTSNWEK